MPYLEYLTLLVFYGIFQRELRLKITRANLDDGNWTSLHIMVSSRSGDPRPKGETP